MTSITCGAGHSLGLSKFGKVYSWGLNVLGQLGHGDTDTRWQPTLVKSIKDFNVTKVIAGAGHSFVVDSKHQVYSWGASADF